MPLACLFRDLVPTAHLRPPCGRDSPHLLIRWDSLLFTGGLPEQPPNRPLPSPRPTNPAQAAALFRGAAACQSLTLFLAGDQRQPGLHGVQSLLHIAHDIRTHDVSLAVHDICSGIGGNIRNEVLVEIALRIREIL